MYIICIESSKNRGMGHLFRSLLYSDYLESIGQNYIILINNDEKSINILKEKNIPFCLVDYSDDSDWQSNLIQKFNASVWIEDKFETSLSMAKNIKKNNILFCAIDEFGPGGDLCDIHFAGMIYLTGHEVRGNKKYCGSEYVILSKEIDSYKKIRNKINRIIITLGGSDPYGNTIDIVKEISSTDFDVSIVIGPDFDYYDELKLANINNYPVLQNVPSLIEELSKYDFAITGGGVTCCEANSCGLPCMIIANAPHEMNTGKYMEKCGGAVYAGSYEGWNKNLIKHLNCFNIEEMSKNGMAHFDTRAVERVFSIIEKEKWVYER